MTSEEKEKLKRMLYIVEDAIATNYHDIEEDWIEYDKLKKELLES